MNSNNNDKILYLPKMSRAVMKLKTKTLKKSKCKKRSLQNFSHMKWIKKINTYDILKNIYMEKILKIFKNRFQNT